MWRADTPIDLSSLAARSPAPGSGTGAAWGCAVAAALAAMAARFAGREEDAQRADVLGAQRRPADDPGREEAVAAALGAAAEVPLGIAEIAAEVAMLARELAGSG